ncbi:MAG: BamA/TamA family outer membrane protein [Phocaeicola sp.]
MKKCLLPHFLLLILLCTSCSVAKFIPENEYLLDNTQITSDTKQVKPTDFEGYVRQTPNSRWFNSLKVPMYIYALSGTDSTQSVNRFLKKLGDEPVIYNQEMAERSRAEIEKAVQNMGYIRASVTLDENIKKNKLKLAYKIRAGKPYSIQNYYYEIQDSLLKEYLLADTTNFLLREGMPLDVNLLNQERQRITKLLQNNGYYKFHKDYITFQADTIRNSYKVDLTLRILPFLGNKEVESQVHEQYRIGKLSFIADKEINPVNSEILQQYDSLSMEGAHIYYAKEHYLRPKTLLNFNRIRPGELYSEQDVQNSYVSLGRLGALKYSNITFEERITDNQKYLDTYVTMAKGRNQSVAFEVEGTNSAGDLGAAASVSYHHQNLFRGSENFTIRLRGAYEAVTGLEGDYASDSYLEYGVETTLTFPEFKFPFLSSEFKKQVRASSELSLKYNPQKRPEFLRTSASASWRYRWVNNRSQHRFSLIDVNYLYIPNSSMSSTFVDYLLELAANNSLVLYSYIDQFIVSMGYSYTYSSTGNSLIKTPTRSSHSVRINIEEAGNMLYAASKVAFGAPEDESKGYVLANIPFAQYVKGDFEYTRNLIIDPRNALVFRAALGIAFPYGNSVALPFEKRYFSGGANSVRGWSIRTLGPGSTKLDDDNSLNTFLCNGDMKIDLNIEYRTDLFWKMKGALFIDAGNIWNLKEDTGYSEESIFKFNKFYKDLAVSYGLGLRVDLDFLVLRFDGGMKAINPMYTGKDRYPVARPKFSRDFAFHFAVGYPF